MSKILVVFTGGTIGSSLNDKGTIGVDESTKKLLVSLYSDRFKSEDSFDTVEPYYELSENIDINHWNRLISFFSSIDFTAYDGIILAHGSDTWSYPAAMLSFALRHSPLPLVLIASNYPITDERSNGVENFAAAVTFIKKGPYSRGVFVCYSNIKTEALVYIGSRVKEADHIFDNFAGIDGSFLCKITNGEIIINQNPLNPSVEEINKDKAPLEIGTPKNNVLLLKSYPGQNFKNISLKGIKAVLAVGYHSATVCDSKIKELSFWEFAKRCKDKGIDIFISSFKAENSVAYESLKGEFNRLCNISTEAAYTKILLAYSTNTPTEIMKSQIYFESV